MPNNSQLKRINMLNIIKAIKYKGEITKPEIVKITGLTQSTIHNFINELLEKQVVTENGIADSTGGRKAFIYKFNAPNYCIAAVDIGDDYITACLFDFDLHEIYKIRENYILHDHNVEEGFEKILGFIRSVMSFSPVNPEKIIGIGISVSGTVDFESGKIYQITDASRWKNVPLAKMIQEKTGIQTILDKDNNSAATYYKLTDVSSGKNLVFLCTRKGIGTGLLIDGNVYRGVHCLAGELGHIRIDSFGEVCKCGKIGCLEPLASDPSIVAHAVKRIQAGSKTLITELCENNLDNITLQVVINAAKRNDDVALDILKNTADYLLMTIGNIIKIYDPDKIILDCIWLKEFNGLFNYIVNRVYEDNEFIDRDHFEIALTREEDILLNGAASLVIDHHLTAYETSKLLD